MSTEPRIRSNIRTSGREGSGSQYIWHRCPPILPRLLVGGIPRPTPVLLLGVRIEGFVDVPLGLTGVHETAQRICSPRQMSSEASSGSGVVALAFFLFKRRRAGNDNDTSSPNQMGYSPTDDQPFHKPLKLYNPADPSTFPSPPPGGDSSNSGVYTKKPYQGGG